MLKKFFISMLGTMAGMWISFFLLIIGGLMIAGIAAGDDTPKVSKHSVLVLDLKGDIQECVQPMSFMSLLQEGDNNAPTLDELLRAVRGAARDSKIEGLYLKCNGASMGAASREELLEAINEFKESGKWIYAYADAYAQGDYLLASAADSILLNPMGAVDIHGVGGATPFFTGLLDKLGVKVQIIKVGTYKSAVEPFILKEMSEPARRQMQQYIDTIWSFTAGNIAANREIPVAEIDSMASQMISQQPAAVFVENGLVTGLTYERTVDDAIAAQLGLDDDEEVSYISATEYLESSDIMSVLENNDKKHIAVYYAVGDISDSGNEGIVGPNVVSDICGLAENDKVKGLVLRVNSPGGSAFASEQIWEAIQYFREQGKPVYVSMGDYAASGGYYISCGADSIFADVTTVTGSIGVFGMIPDFSGLVTDKLGVTFSTVETNPNAAGVMLTKAMTPEQHAAMQKSVENIYELFTSRVAEGRGMEQDSVKAIAEGRVWIGADAVQLGLVDRIGSLYTAVGAMARDLDMTRKDVVAYPQNEETMWMQMLRESGSLDGLRAGDMPFDAETARFLHLVKTLRTMNPMQARMEAIEIR